MIMGVINVTPDSFSDGGDYLDPGAAVDHARRLITQGAGIIDVGAESTRPGSTGISAADEWRRLEPLLKRLQQARLGVPISVDTCKEDIMLRALDAGADWINDTSGKASLATLARFATYRQMSYIAMHMPWTPDIMQTTPLGPGPALAAVATFFAHRHQTALEAGLEPTQIWLDPGIGFGKTDAANVQAMAAVKTWAKTYQIAVGVSRKSLLGRTLGIDAPKQRDAPSKTLELGLVMLGARLIRTHSVLPLKRLLDLLGEGVHV